MTHMGKREIAAVSRTLPDNPGELACMHTGVEFVVGSFPCFERFFSGYSGFILSSKTNMSKFQFNQE